MKTLLIILTALLLTVSAYAGTRYIMSPHTGKLDAVGGNAADISYSKSGVSATNAKDALDYLFNNLSSAGGGGGGATSADQVSYANPTYTTVEAALNQLLYVAPGSPSVSGGGSYETGQTITSVVLNWSITLGNKALTTQSIDNSIGSISTALRAYTHSGQSITTNRTYTVSISDGTTNRSGSTTIAFYPKRYWGTSALTTLTSAQILALSGNELTSGHGKSGVVYNCSGGLYPYYAYPTSYGLLSATTVGGLAFTDYTYQTVSHTNASGYTQNYYVYRFNSLQSGSAITVNWD